MLTLDNAAFILATPIAMQPTRHADPSFKVEEFEQKLNPHRSDSGHRDTVGPLVLHAMRMCTGTMGTRSGGYSDALSNHAGMGAQAPKRGFKEKRC